MKNKAKGYLIIMLTFLAIGVLLSLVEPVFVVIYIFSITLSVLAAFYIGVEYLFKED